MWLLFVPTDVRRRSRSKIRKLKARRWHQSEAKEKPDGGTDIAVLSELFQSKVIIPQHPKKAGIEGICDFLVISSGDANSKKNTVWYCTVM